MGTNTSNDLDAKITSAVKAKLAAAVAEAVQKALANQNAGQQSAQSLLRMSESTTSTLLAFKLEEIGYFNPELDIHYGEGDIITVSKDLYTRDMHLFVNWIKDAVGLKEAD